MLLCAYFVVCIFSFQKKDVFAKHLWVWDSSTCGDMASDVLSILRFSDMYLYIYSELGLPCHIIHSSKATQESRIAVAPRKWTCVRLECMRLSCLCFGQMSDVV